MYCLDTNIVVDILRGDLKLADKIKNLLEFGTPIYLSTITLCELYRGAYLHVFSGDKLKEVESIIANFDIIELDKWSCRIFGEEYSRLKKSGRIISDFDLMIASICKANNLILITRDKQHFKDFNIKVEAW